MDQIKRRETSPTGGLLCCSCSSGLGHCAVRANIIVALKVKSIACNDHLRFTRFVWHTYACENEGANFLQPSSMADICLRTFLTKEVCMLPIMGTKF